MATALLVLATGCGAENGSPRSYPTSETEISAHAGEKFTLAVDELPGENWYLVAPKPDASVVRGTGHDYEASDRTGNLPGARHRHVFAFKATGAGSTEIVLLHCPVSACTGGTESPAQATPTASVFLPDPERITYTVTVT